MTTPAISQHSRLSGDEVQQVLALVDAVTEADGVRPLSEHVMLHLRYGGDEPGRNLLVRAGDELVGYAFLDTTDAVEGSSAEIAMTPAHRQNAIARELVEALVDQTPDGRLRLWAHGQQAANSSLARSLAQSLGFERERVLWQMRRSLFAPLPAPEFPPDVVLRTFLVGRDESAWIEVNNRAFAHHPDQGHWTVEDVRRREAEPWFDPAGFFLAERAGRLVGFHWTKVHGGSGSGPGTRTGERTGEQTGEHGHEPIGEVYVVGVDPDAQGQRLGPALTLVGLARLRGKGLAQAMLYVDESNTAAIKVYEELGFTRWDVDVNYRRG
ncbi:MAG: mycothiol synthase [Frankiaceae bacterium]